MAHTLNEIASSEFIITEALHGAILADTLRVPWHRFVLSTPAPEGQLVSEFKWIDWQLSIDQFKTQVSQIRFLRRSKLHDWIKRGTADILSTAFFFKKMVKTELLDKLSRVKNFYLSQDHCMAEIDRKIKFQIQRLIEDERKGFFGSQK